MTQNFKKVVIWGHKPRISVKFGVFPKGRHTHSYIHEGYYRGFRDLGYETFWFDNEDNVEGFNFDNALFFTEDQAQSNIPLRKSATYVLHHTPSDKYQNAGARILNLCNYVKDVEDGISFNYPGSSVTKISDLVFFDSVNRALYQPWATNLLPREIRSDYFWPYKESELNVNYIGTTGHEDLPLRFKRFKNSLEESGSKFNLYSRVDELTAQSLVESSRVSVDIRGSWHLERGYIPCRIWKSLSYGKFVGSNSPILKNVFSDFLHVDPEESTLFHSTEDSYRHLKKAKMLESINWVKSKHTYINRANSILAILDL